MLAILVNTATLAFFGRLSVLQSILVECGVEVVPEGEHALFHVPWERSASRRARSSFRLRHSEPYLTAVALDRIGAWIRARTIARKITA